jgi:phage shock protein C
MEAKKLYRSRDRMLGGVLAGFSEHINADVSIVRIAYVLISIISIAFPGLLFYLICWAVIPEKPLKE